jgi:ABC-2 type transport system permease protein
MNNIWLLTKIMLKNAGPLWKSKKGSGWKSLLLILLIFVGFMPMIFSGVWMISGLYDGLALVGQESALLGLGLALVSLTIFLLGIVYILTVFYYSQDVEHFLPLPLAPREILGAKFLVALLYEYLTALIMLGPLLIVYGVKSDAGVLYYLFSILLFLVFPVVPLVLAALVIMLFMRYTNLGQKKDRFRMIGGILGLGVVIGFQFLIQSNKGSLTDLEQLQQQILASDNMLLNLVTKLSPTSELAVHALVNSSNLAGLGYLVAFLLITAAAMLIFLYAGDRLYFGGVMGVSESASKRKQVGDESFAKLAKVRSPWWSYALKEWRILWRTPAYLLNCLLPSLIMPLLILAPLFGIQGERDLITAIGEWIEGSGGLSLAIFFAGSVFLAGLNSASATAITRDGQGFMMNKAFPLSFTHFLAGKLLPGTIISLISIIFLMIVAALFIKISSTFLLIGFLVALPGIILINLLGIMIDIHMPKLVWTSEQEAVKQNLNPLFAILVAMLTAGGTLLLVFLTQSQGALLSVALMLVLAFTCLDYLLYRVMIKKGPAWLEKIED